MYGLNIPSRLKQKAKCFINKENNDFFFFLIFKYAQNVVNLWVTREFVDDLCCVFQDLYCVRSDLGNLLKALGRLDEAKVWIASVLYLAMSQLIGWCLGSVNVSFVDL